MTIAPLIGTGDLGKFYENLLASVKGIHFSPRNLLREDKSLPQRASALRTPNQTGESFMI